MGSIDNIACSPPILLNGVDVQKEGKKTELTRANGLLGHETSIIEEEKEAKRTEPPGATDGPDQKNSTIEKEKKADESQQITEQTDRGPACTSMTEPDMRS